MPRYAPEPFKHPKPEEDGIEEAEEYSESDEWGEVKEGRRGGG